MQAPAWLRVIRSKTIWSTQHFTDTIWSANLRYFAAVYSAICSLFKSAKCQSAKCQSAKCQSAKCQSAKCQSASVSRPSVSRPNVSRPKDFRPKESELADLSVGGDENNGFLRRFYFVGTEPTEVKILNSFHFYTKNQGTLTEREGSVPLTSSLRVDVL